MLESIFRSGRSEFVALYGRRRVGKTFLINSFFRGRCPVFELTGIRGASLAAQLASFGVELGDIFLDERPQPSPSSWLEAFDQLRRQLEKTRIDDRFVVFLDELPWLATQRSGFLGALGHFWNRYVSRDRRIILIVCGSAASWMLKKVVSDKGGLHGRLTGRMRLQPFTLSEAEQLLSLNGVHLDRKQIVELYMAFGGIPKYLEQARPGRSGAQIINDTCFSPTGYLREEFKDLYRSLFDQSDLHLRIIKVLAQKLSGMTQPELWHACRVSSGGRSTRVLTELEESAFVTRVLPLGQAKKEARIRLSDEYSLFYLKWIDGVPMGAGELDRDYWLKKQATQTWRSWSGYAFESVCLKHIDSIKSALGISGVNTRHAGWLLRGKGSEAGAQIDLVIDRDDHCINLVEMKFHRAPFRITKEYARQLESKRDQLIQETRTKKTVFVTMLTACGVEEDEHYHRVVTNQLTADALFDAEGRAARPI